MFGGVFDSSGKINTYAAKFLFVAAFAALGEEPKEKPVKKANNPFGNLLAGAVAAGNQPKTGGQGLTDEEVKEVVEEAKEEVEVDHEHELAADFFNASLMAKEANNQETAKIASGGTENYMAAFLTDVVTGKK